MRCLEVADISCRFLYIKKRYLKLLSSKPWLLTPTWAAGLHSVGHRNILHSSCVLTCHCVDELMFG